VKSASELPPYAGRSISAARWNALASRVHLLLERVVHIGDHRSPEARNASRFRAGLGPLTPSRQPCTLNRAWQRPDWSEPYSTLATRYTDTRLPDSEKARSWCPCLATLGLAEPRRSAGLGGCAARLTRRLPVPRSRRCRDQPARHDERTQPLRDDDVNRESGTEAANRLGRWIRALESQSRFRA
jgi:hypothetical protein